MTAIYPRWLGFAAILCILSGGASGQNLLRTLQSDVYDCTFGSNMAFAGDVNADGFPDIIVGSLGSHFASVRSGADGSVLHHFPEPPNLVTSNWARAVAGVGDVDNDGYSDVAVADPWYEPGGVYDVGILQVYSGLSGAVLLEIDGFPERGQFGWSMDALGDVNGDGHDDFIVKMPNAADHIVLEEGHSVDVGWNAEDCRALDA